MLDKNIKIEYINPRTKEEMIAFCSENGSLQFVDMTMEEIIEKFGEIPNELIDKTGARIQTKTRLITGFINTTSKLKLNYAAAP